MVRPRIVVIGSANVDYAVATERLPAPGETVTNGTLLVSHGGKGANAAVAARRLGADVRFSGCVGDDSAGAAIRTQLAAEGIGADGLTVTRDASTGTALIVVDAHGQNQIAVAPGANHRLTLDMLPGLEADLDWAHVLLCPLESPVSTVLGALAAARRHGVTTILNPAPVKPLPDDAWPLVDYLTPNAGEAAAFTGAPVNTVADAERASRALVARGAHTAIVTLGGAGVVAFDGHAPYRIPAVDVAAIDTTAAGDAFNGALAVALGERRALPNALCFAVTAAGLACTKRGAQPSLPTRAEVDTVLA